MSATAPRRVFAPEDEKTRALRDQAYDEVRAEVNRRQAERARRQSKGMRRLILVGSLSAALSFMFGYLLFA